MSRGGHRDEGGEPLSLFDLPLRNDPAAGDRFDDPPPPAPARSKTSAPPAAEPTPRPEPLTTSGLFEQLAERHVDIAPVPAPRLPPAEECPAGSLERLRAGIADLAAVALAVAVGAVCAMVLGVPLSAGRWPPLLVLGAAFSFPYVVVPLAFWGQTPGMAWSGLIARAEGGEPLTFQQTALRWIGALFTTLLAGLPLLLTLAGGSLADRLSGSEVVRLVPDA